MMVFGVKGNSRQPAAVFGFRRITAARELPDNLYDATSKQRHRAGCRI